MPAGVRTHAKLSVDGPVHEKWTFGYLIDLIYLRDLWIHRVDVAFAVNCPPEISADHDGRIVADVVAEWARRHWKPFRLELTGAAGNLYKVESTREDASSRPSFPSESGGRLKVQHPSGVRQSDRTYA